MAQSQGVSKTEILVGSILDMSGPLASYGKAVRQGMLLRADEANEQGGVHGRKIKLVVEDDGYDPKRAVLAAQKLVNQDKVFIVAGHIGTAQNNAAMPVQFEKNVINFLPITAAREMYEPFNRLKYLVRRRRTTTRCAPACPSWSRKRARRRSARSIRTTTSGWRCCAAPRPA